MENHLYLSFRQVLENAELDFAIVHYYGNITATRWLGESWPTATKA